jgi:hypothetical protein
MTGYLDKTISALACELVAMHEGPPSEASPSHEHVITFVREQLNRMPWFLGWAIKAVTCVFGISGFVDVPAFFFLKRPRQRKRHVEKWRTSRLKMCRDLIKFYAALVAFALYSQSKTSQGGEVQ